MRKACPYCKLIMYPVYRFSKNRIEYLLKCDNCHYEERSAGIFVKDETGKLAKAIIGVPNGAK